MKKALLRKLLTASQFIIKESRNKEAANKSWFTVLMAFYMNENSFSNIEK
jgi:hypothetical protein